MRGVRPSGEVWLTLLYEFGGLGARMDFSLDDLDDDGFRALARDALPPLGQLDVAAQRGASSHPGDARLCELRIFCAGPDHS